MVLEKRVSVRGYVLRMGIDLFSIQRRENNWREIIRKVKMIPRAFLRRCNLG